MIKINYNLIFKILIILIKNKDILKIKKILSNEVIVL